MKIVLKIAIVVGIASLCCAGMMGCHKSKVNCNYVVIPKIKLKDQTGKDSLAAVASTENVVAYAFIADTAQWSVVSFAKAEAGIITHRTTAEERSADFTAVWGASDRLEMSPIKSKKLILIVCYSYPENTEHKYPANKIYAWRSAAVEADISQIVVPVIFNPFESTGNEYEELKWITLNETVYVAPEPDPEP